MSPRSVPVQTNRPLVSDVLCLLQQKATFAFIDKVELFLRTGTFPADATKNSKKVTRASSKRFTYKGTLELGCFLLTRAA